MFFFIIQFYGDIGMMEQVWALEKKLILIVIIIIIIIMRAASLVLLGSCPFWAQ